MTARKKVPADVAVLKQLTGEQAIKIADLEKQLKDKAQTLEYCERQVNDLSRDRETLVLQIDEVHALIDACASALPRFSITPAKNSWSEDTKRENSIMLRLASFMGARG